MPGWVSESYAPSCTSLTPSMRGVTRSHIKGGVDLQNVKLLSFKSVCFPVCGSWILDDLSAYSEKVHKIQLWAMQFLQVHTMDSISAAFCISDVWNILPDIFEG